MADGGKCQVLSFDIKICGPFLKEIQIAQTGQGRRAQLIAGLVHVWESNSPARAATLHPAGVMFGGI